MHLDRGNFLQTLLSLSSADIRLPDGSMKALTVKRHSLSSPPLKHKWTRWTKHPCVSKSGQQQRMADSDLNLVYHGLLLPKLAHTEESLNYLQNFQVKDDDVFAVTYPKSGKIILWFRCMLFISPHAFNKSDLMHSICSSYCYNLCKRCNIEYAYTHI